MSNKIIQLDIEIVENKGECELLLDKLITYNTYMKSTWGDYKKKSGWDIKRLKIVDTSTKRLVACCQLQFKKKSFINIYLI